MPNAAASDAAEGKAAGEGRAAIGCVRARAAEAARAAGPEPGAATLVCAAFWRPAVGWQAAQRHMSPTQAEEAEDPDADKS